MDWAIGEGSKAIIVFAFKIDIQPKTLQYIFHREQDDRGIYLKDNHLHIKTSKTESVSVNYIENDWNICYIELNNFANEEHSYYKINDQEGTFLIENGDNLNTVIFLGGSSRGAHCFNGAIARIDFLSKIMPQSSCSFENLSETVQKSIIQEYYMIYRNK